VLISFPVTWVLQFFCWQCNPEVSAENMHVSAHIGADIYPHADRRIRSNDQLNQVGHFRVSTAVEEGWANRGELCQVIAIPFLPWIAPGCSPLVLITPLCWSLPCAPLMLLSAPAPLMLLPPCAPLLLPPPDLFCSFYSVLVLIVLILYCLSLCRKCCSGFSRQ